MIVLVLALQLWTVLFVGFFGSELLGSYPGLRIAAQLLFVTPLVVWAVVRLRGPRTTLDWAILAALAALLVVSFFSADVQGSLESVGLAMAYALTFFAMREVGSMPRLRTAVAVAASYAIVFWLVMVAIWWIGEKLAWVSAFGSLPNLESNQVFIWGTANVFPIFTLLAIPLLRWQPAGLGRRVLAALWAVASVITIPLSAGRAGWVGLLVAALAYDAFSGWRWTRAALGWLRSRRLVMAASVAAAAVAGFAGVFVATHFGRLLDAALDGRGEIWRQALAVFAADPLTGGGPSTYSWLRLTHVPDYTYPVPVRLAHDVPLLTAADGGIILLAGFLALLVAFAFAARPHLVDAQRRTAAAVLAGFAAASLFDDFSSLPAVIAVVVTLAAWTVTRQAEPVLRPTLPRWRGALLPVALAVTGSLLLLPSVIGVDAARTAADAGRQAAVRSDWKLAVDRFGVATSAYATDAGYWLGLGLARAQLGQADAAVSAYERARQVSPGDARSWGALGALSTNPAERVRLLREAARRTVLDATFSFQLGAALLQTGQSAEAIQAYATAVALDRGLITAFSGSTTPTRAQVGAAVGGVAAQLGARAALAPDIVAWDLALADDRLPDGGAAWRAISFAAHGQAVEARAAANEASRDAPYDVTTLRGLQAAAWLTCDQQRYDAISGYLGPFRAPHPGPLGIIREHVYREDALSSYQPPVAGVAPPSEPVAPVAQAWPWSLIGDPPTCAGWTSP